MKLGVRFCGGCNPRYDRGAALREIREALPEHQFLIAQEDDEYDHLLVIGGCTACCAGYDQFTNRGNVIKNWDGSHIEGTKETIKKLANNIHEDD